MPKPLSECVGPLEIAVAVGENLVEIGNDLYTQLQAAQAEALSWRRFGEWHLVGERPDTFPCSIEFICVNLLSFAWVVAGCTEQEFDLRMRDRSVYTHWRYFNLPAGKVTRE